MGRIYPAGATGPRAYSDTAYRRPDDDVDQPSAGVRAVRPPLAADRRRPGVAVDDGVDVGDHQPVGVRQEGGVDRSAADHPERLVLGEHLRHRRRPPRPVGRPVAGPTSGRRWSGRAAGGTASGSDSQVRRPMTTVEPDGQRAEQRQVLRQVPGQRRRRRRSTPPRACAQIERLPGDLAARSHRHGCPDRRVGPVVAHREVLVGVVEQRRRRAPAPASGTAAPRGRAARVTCAVWLL